MAIKIGDRVPDATFKVMTKDGPADRASADVFNGRTVALFAVPAAFSPTCQNRHLPSFLDGMDALKAKGVDAVACTAVNDVWVLSAWAKATGADGKIEFLADGNGDFAKAVGLDRDATGVGQGLRSKRYAMLVENGVVKALNVDEVPGKAEASTAEGLLKSI